MSYRHTNIIVLLALDGLWMDELCMCGGLGGRGLRGRGLGLRGLLLGVHRRAARTVNAAGRLVLVGDSTIAAAAAVLVAGAGLVERRAAHHPTPVKRKRESEGHA